LGANREIRGGLIAAIRSITMTTMDKLPASSDLHAFTRLFVRERLGCGCPDELLDRIEIDARPGLPPRTQLRVGGRLLVHVRACPEPSRLPHLLAGWLADGVAQRDVMGFNRFRLVLIVTDPDAVRPNAEALFASWGGDDRTHLHLLRSDEIGPLLPTGPV